MLERIPEKKVVITEDNRRILDSLENALMRNGLGDVLENKAFKSEITADDARDRKGLTIHVLKIAEMATGDSLGAKEKKFPEILISLDPDPYELRDSYISYLNGLIRKEKITPLEASNTLIKSPFVLVREILIRLCSVALCNDNDLKRDGSKLINALIDFQSMIISSHVLDGPAFFDNLMGKKHLSEFSKAFASSHLQWNNFLREMVRTTNELHANIKIVTETLASLIKWEKNIKRHLIVRICIGGSLNFEDGCLSSEWINDTLTDYENKIVNKHSSIKTYSFLGENENNLISLNIIEKPELIKQDKIIQILQKIKVPNVDKIKNLYDVFAQTRLMISIFNSLHSMFLIGGWIPIMMKAINLKNISQLLSKHVIECQTHLKISHHDPMLDTKAGYELAQYQVDISRLQDITIACSDELIKLDDKKLILKLKQRIEGNLIQLSHLEKIVGIEMINTLEEKSVSSASIIASGLTKSPVITNSKAEIKSNIPSIQSDSQEEAKLILNKAIDADTVEDSIVYLNKLIDDLGYDNADHLYLRASYYMVRNYWSDALRDVNKILHEKPDHAGAKDLFNEIVKTQSEFTTTYKK